MTNAALKKVDVAEPDIQFDFGANWADFSKQVNDQRIQDAEDGLRRLVPEADLRGKSFLDIGCGSGLHTLAALRLGVASVTAVDVNPRSVSTTRAVLAKFLPHAQADVLQHSILSTVLPESLHRSFDIVYSWGVLHHTGHMLQAISAAAARVTPGGAAGARDL